MLCRFLFTDAALLFSLMNMSLFCFFLQNEIGSELIRRTGDVDKGFFFSVCLQQNELISNGLIEIVTKLYQKV